MALLDEERYLRHIWLLGEGGLFVLRGVVSREATKTGSTLDNLLHNGRAKFKGVLQEQQHCLFPTPTTVNADTYTWDMSLLFVVLKKLFWSGLSLSERCFLSALKTYRNDIQGHPPILSMNAFDYSSKRQLLEQALRQLASGINGNVEIESIIKRTTTGRIDSDSILTYIREIYDFKTSFLTAVEDMLQRINSKFSSFQGKFWKQSDPSEALLKLISSHESEPSAAGKFWKQSDPSEALLKLISSHVDIKRDRLTNIY